MVPTQEDGLPAVEPDDIPLHELPDHPLVQEEQDLEEELWPPSKTEAIAAWLARQHDIFADLVTQPELQQHENTTSRRSFINATTGPRQRQQQPIPHDNMRPMLQAWTTQGVKLRPTKDISPTIQQDTYIRKNTKIFNKVEEEIIALYNKGYITNIDKSKVKCSMPLFAVPKSSQDKHSIRLVYDARHINTFLKPPPFNLPVVPKSLRSAPKGFAFVSDISAGYHHVPLHPSAKPFLCFQWRKKFFCWNVLPFGLSTAPWIFQTWLDSYLQQWKKQHRNTFIRQYIDDILVVHKSQEQCQLLRQSLLSFLKQHDIKAHEDKTTPVQSQLQYLGYQINFLQGTVSLSKGRLAQIRRIIKFINKHQTIPKKFLEKFLGLINWCRAGAKSILARLLPFYQQMHKISSRFVKIKNGLFDFLAEELQQTRSFRYNTAPFRIYTDATLKQGAYIDDRPHNFLIPYKYQSSSFTSEFYAAAQALKYNKHHHHIRLYCDNLGVCYSLKKGSSHHTLIGKQLVRLWKILEHNNVKLSIVWIPSEHNPADYYSRSALLAHYR